MILHAGQQRDTDVKDRFLYSVGGGECGMTWENNTETYILLYVIQITSVSSLPEAGYPKPMLGTAWKDGVGRGW